ncbi:MAG: segregation/condensation protein A [Aphanothece sp. CMT-3BRIN-NPC111]|nr:segregation/condensation protein A [Aphanothece sp. CMT-3BRIN-NPC111]
MTVSSTQDELAELPQGVASLKEIGIAILIDLAQRGEIDPWDVQVIDVIDRYLSQLAFAGDAESGSRDADLSESGQAFLWASMLVLLKADTLGRLQTPDANPDETGAEADAWDQATLPAHLERHLRRRPTAQPPQRRPVTLQELIDQLRQMAAALEEKPPRPRSGRFTAQSPTQAERLAKLSEEITQLAHNENLTEIAGELDRFLSGRWSESVQGQNWLDLEQLLELWSGVGASVEAPEPQPYDRVGVFWALLLLSAQSKVELSQEEFYQDIKIRTLRADE